MNKIIGGGIFDPVGGGGDTTAPTLQSATIQAAGLTINLVFDEAVTFGAGGNAGWILTMSGGIINGAAVTLVYTLSRKVFSDETGSLSYTQPGSGVEDLAGNDLANIVGGAVINSSTQVWTPLEITGCKLWLKADSIVGLSDGDPIGTWPDSSLLGNDVSQSTAGNKPTYQTNEINTTLPIVRFDGSDWLRRTLPAAMINDFYTWFVVVKCTGAAKFIMTMGDATVADQATIYRGEGVDTFRYSSYDDDVALDAINGATSITNIYALLVARRGSSSPNLSIFVNGVSDSPGDDYANPGANYGEAGSPVVTLGARSDNSSPLIADVAEILAYNSALSTANRQSIEGYLNTKYEIY
jgi:hypothetical protein